MKAVLITPATFEPITVDDMKSYPEIRIDADEHGDDPILAAYRKVAIRAYENYTGRILCSSTWDLYLDEFPDEIELPAPLISATITYYDIDNVLQTLATTYYKVLIRNPVYGSIALKSDQSWPDTYDEPEVVIVRFVAGYATAEDIPQEIIQGLLLKIQELYDGVDRRVAYEACWVAEARLPI